MKYLIFGLGNIGAEYANTRHNIGFVVMDALAQSTGATFETDRYASVARIKYRGRTLVLIKPTTYMNHSGKAVRYWINREKVALDKVLVVVDDIALPLGAIRLRAKGGDGGHNGLENIIYHLETIEFPRLRFGIGDDFARGTQVDYVLSQWTRKEEKILIPRIPEAVDAIKNFVTIGLERTMNEVNKKDEQ